jgi:hypothetical protein
MPVDDNEQNFGLVIQDYDGFTVSGSTYFVAYDGTTRGMKVLLGRPYTATMGSQIDIATKTNVPLLTTIPHSQHHNHVKITGLKRMTFTVSCAIDAETRGLDFAPAGYQRLDFQTLRDLLYFNHRYYITDYHGSESTTESLIYTWMNETNSRYYALYGSASIGPKGLPVVIQEITGISVDKGIATFQITLVEDTNET